MEDWPTFENLVLLNFELLFSSRVETWPVQIFSLNIHPKSIVIYNLEALDFQREIDLETLGWRTRLLSPDYCLFCFLVRRQKLQQMTFFCLSVPTGSKRLTQLLDADYNEKEGEDRNPIDEY